MSGFQYGVRFLGMSERLLGMAEFARNDESWKNIDGEIQKSFQLK